MIRFRLTANQLTVSRIVLMPVPVALVLTGDRSMQLVAWVLYVIIGITDYFDGMLARRHGFTRFGRLTDPIADKIYVALVFIPLAILGLMPGWIMVLVLMRDPLITALRSLSERYGLPMQTATLAKYKTAIQMIAGGYILWAGIVPEKAWTLTAMSITAGLAWFFYVLKWFLRRKLDPRLLTMGGLMSFGLVVRAMCNVHLTLYIYSLLILGITWISAWKYLADFASGVGKSARKVGTLTLILYAAESIVIPLFALALLFHPSIPVWLPMCIACIELALGALDNMLTAEGQSRSTRHVIIKLSLQAMAAAAFVSAPIMPTLLPGPPLDLPTVAALAFGVVTLLTTVIAFARYGPRIL